jgi:hypothetical protein
VLFVPTPDDGETKAEILLYWTVIVSWLAASAYTLIR